MLSAHLPDSCRGRVRIAEVELVAASHEVYQDSPPTNRSSALSRLPLFLCGWQASNFTFMKWLKKIQKNTMVKHMKTV